MLRSLTTWLHDGDPAPLRFENPLRAIKEAVAGGERYFEGLLTRWLIDNRHRVTDPEPGYRDGRAAGAGGSGTPADRQRGHGRRAPAWKPRFWPCGNGSPGRTCRRNWPRSRALVLRTCRWKIPVSRRNALGRRGRSCFSTLPTNGIIYAEAAFELNTVPEELLPLLPLFGRLRLKWARGPAILWI